MAFRSRLPALLIVVPCCSVCRCVTRRPRAPGWETMGRVGQGEQAQFRHSLAASRLAERRSREAQCLDEYLTQGSPR